MKLVSYIQDGHDRLALEVNGLLFDVELIHPDLPGNMSMFLNYWDELLSTAQAGELAIMDGHIPQSKGKLIDSVGILAPVPFPSSCRDGYAFRQHVEAARRNRGASMIAE